MHVRFLAGTALSLALALRPAATVAEAGADLDRGRELYGANCIACHGDRAQGKHELNSPALHQQQDWYLAAQIEKFRQGQRGGDPHDLTGAQMAPMAMAIPDEQAVEDLAAYISSIEGPPPDHRLDGDATAGKTMYVLCSGCHGENGQGKKELRTPALAGQNDWYLAAQLHKFREGTRGTHPEDITGAQMRPMALTLPTDQTVRDVVAYIASLGPEPAAPSSSVP